MRVIMQLKPPIKIWRLSWIKLLKTKIMGLRQTLLTIRSKINNHAMDNISKLIKMIIDLGQALVSEVGKTRHRCPSHRMVLMIAWWGRRQQWLLDLQINDTRILGWVDQLFLNLCLKTRIQIYAPNWDARMNSQRSLEDLIHQLKLLSKMHKTLATTKKDSRVSLKVRAIIQSCAHSKLKDHLTQIRLGLNSINHMVHSYHTTIKLILAKIMLMQIASVKFPKLSIHHKQFHRLRNHNHTLLLNLSSQIRKIIKILLIMQINKHKHLQTKQ